MRTTAGLCPQTVKALENMAHASVEQYGTSMVPLNRLLWGNLTPAQVPTWSAEMASYFLTWRNQPLPAGTTTALYDIVMRAISHSGLLLTDAHVRTAYVAAYLGSVPQPHAFHNHYHTLEVVCLTLRLIAMQTSMGTSITPHEILECVIAACIHDFAHGGHGNHTKCDVAGLQHAPMHMEERALQHAMPFLKLAGFDANAAARVSVMVLATDVSKPEPISISPAMWLRHAYGHHYSAPLDAATWQDCPAALQPLFSDARLCMQAMLVEEADLGSSAAMPYDFAKLMTKLLAKENTAIASRPETLVSFLNTICGDSFVTDAGQMLMNKNRKSLEMDALQDMHGMLYSWS